MSKLKLSDKLINSSKAYLDSYLKHPKLVKLFISGVDQNDEKGIEWYWKETLPIIAYAIVIIDIAINTSINEERPKDQAFYEKLHALISASKNRLSLVYEQKFGTVSYDVLKQSFTQSWLAVKQYMYNMDTNNELATLFLASYWLKQEASGLMKRHPNYKPNPCFEFIYGYDYTPIVNEIRAFIDQIGATIDSTEEASLMEIFHRVLEREINFFNFV